MDSTPPDNSPQSAQHDSAQLKPLEIADVGMSEPQQARNLGKLPSARTPSSTGAPSVPTSSPTSKIPTAPEPPKLPGVHPVPGTLPEEATSNRMKTVYEYVCSAPEKHVTTKTVHVGAPPPMQLSCEHLAVRNMDSIQAVGKPKCNAPLTLVRMEAKLD